MARNQVSPLFRHTSGSQYKNSVRYDRHHRSTPKVKDVWAFQDIHTFGGILNSKTGCNII
jgi:hypothetical protein